MTNQHTDKMQGAFEQWVESRRDYNMIRHDDAFACGYQAATTRYQAALREASTLASKYMDCEHPDFNKDWEALANINKLLG